MLTIIVVDTETGGLDPKTACIIDLAAQVLHYMPGKGFMLGESFASRIKPDRDVHPKAAKVNGYNPIEWYGEPSGQEVLSRFKTWLEAVAREHEKPMWGGANPYFDLKFFASDCARFEIPEPHGLSHRILDVQSLALPLFLYGEVPTLGLRHLRQWAGCEGEQKHTALDDVLDTCQVIERLITNYA